MATQLIKHLKDCAEKDAIYKPLESQWTFDERLIAKALQNVGVYFPHYSRHDESHSRQILVHIERLLGPDNIAKLSPTDTWLLLEAAYLHDIGMIISDDRLKEDYEAIKKHAEKARYSANGDVLIVMNALLASKEKTASSIFASVDISPFQAVKLLREIIADFYRAQHPDRANRIIPNPFDEIGLDSPRNELLPARFFSLLGKICAYHGDSFDKVMELPKQQVGIGTDDCHPRFIACLLRLGDLLDLDDNRFCPVMMKVAGKLPELSEAHRQKHLAICHFRADPDRIEIEAECPDYESYIETTKWFGWLRDEVKNQMSRWFDIVPERSFGLLPSVGDLKAHLKDWQVFSENQRPHFELDQDRIFELLQGAGLYECKEQAMRELLQNAVDATLIRIWREHGKDCQQQPEIFIKRDSAPRSEEVQNILSRYAIDVSIEKEKEEEQYNYWRITIADQGTGISRDDLKFMLQMGSSKKNYRKRAIIEKMPVWMMPSGIFGIGLHSVFLLTDEVLIETRSIDTGETLVIRMTNPTDSQEHGNVYFQIITKPTTIELNSPNSKKISREFKPWDFSHYGCRLSFIYNPDKTISQRKEHDSITNAFKNHDGLVRDDLDNRHLLNIIGFISDFFKYSYISTTLKLDDEHQKIENGNNSNTENEAYYYDADKSIELIKIEPFSSDSIFDTTNFFYRGQKVRGKYHHSFFRLITVSFNLLNDNADEILTINRNEFKDNDKNDEILIKSAIEIFESFFNCPLGESFYQAQTDEFKATISAEYKLLNTNYPDYFLDWSQMLVKCRNEIIKIEQLKNYEVIFCFNDREIENNLEYGQQLNNLLAKHNEAVALYIENSWRNRAIYKLVHTYLKDQGFSSNYIIEDGIEIVKISKEPSEPITESMLKDYCKKTLLGNEIVEEFLKRRTIPCNEKHKELILKDNILPCLENENFGHPIQPSFSLDLISPRMLFPLARIGDKITEGDINILAKRVYKNRADEKATEDQIKQKYQEFIAFLDNLMKDEEEWIKLRGSEFNPAPTDNYSHGG
jgi:hypothetical protein